MSGNNRSGQNRSGGAPLVAAGQVTANVGVDPAQLSDAERQRMQQAQAKVQDDAAAAQAESEKAIAEQREEQLAALAEAQGKFVMSQAELDEQVAKAVEERLAANAGAMASGPETIQMPSPAAASQAVLEERARLGFAPFAAGQMPASALPAESAKEVRRSISPAHPVHGTITEIYEGGQHIGFAMPSGPRVIDVDTQVPVGSGAAE